MTMLHRLRQAKSTSLVIKPTVLNERFIHCAAKKKNKNAPLQKLECFQTTQ